MAEITAALVKQLREMTGAGMMECKKALVEADGDIDKAIDILRTRGLAASAKKAGRATNEGTVATFISEDGKKGAMVELQCETDFVGMNATFKEFANLLAELAALSNPSDVESFKKVKVADFIEYDGKADETVESMLVDKISTIGENMNIAQVVTDYVDDEGQIASYIHMGGKIGDLVKFAFDKAETAKNEKFEEFAHDVAMQVAASVPLAARREDIAQDVIDHEMNIYKAQAEQSGKPEAIQEKIAAGRLEKFYKESVLTEQAFIKDPDKSIAQLKSEVEKDADDKIEIINFHRFVLGEGNDEE
ncbi:MAG: translation elongation factor Ts [Coriobacteriia bacterium]|nr:translation elongation factor Ts [Coriobacteriia bacterium]